MVDKALPGRQNANAGFLDVSGERAGGEEEVVGVAVDVAEGVFLAGFEPNGVVVSVALTPGSVMEEIIADPEIGHRGLRRNSFDCRVWVDGGFNGEKARIRNTHHADATIVVRHILDEPGYCVVCVRSFVDAIRVG